MSLERPLSLLSDDELLRNLVALLSRSRRVESDLVARIGEVMGKISQYSGSRVEGTARHPPGARGSTPKHVGS
jgi:hypothetical protein